MLQVSCAGCGKVLRARDELAGKKVKCPDCGDVVPVPAQNGKAAAVTTQARKAAARPADDEDLDDVLPAEEDDAPRRPRRKQKAQKSSATAWILGGVGAALVLLLLVGGVVGFVIYRATRADPVQQLADNSDKTKPNATDTQPARDPKPDQTGKDKDGRPDDKPKDPKTDPNPTPKPVSDATRELLLGRWTAAGKILNFQRGDKLRVKTPQRDFQGTYTLQPDEILAAALDDQGVPEALSGRWHFSVTSTTLKLWRADQPLAQVFEYRRMTAGDDTQPVTQGKPWPAKKSHAGGKDLTILEELRVPAAAKGPAVSVALSPDAKVLATGGDKVTLWDITTDPPRQRTTLDGPVRALAFSPDGNFLAAAGSENNVRVWGLGGGAPKELQVAKTHAGPVNAVAFSPDGKTLASGSDDKTVILWDVGPGGVTDQGVLGSADDKAAPGVRSVAFVPNAKSLVTAGNGFWQLWDVSSKKALGARKPLQGSGGDLPLAVSPDGQALALGAANVVVEIVGPRTNPLRGHTDQVTGVGFLPDFKTLVSISLDGHLVLWETATGRTLHTKSGHGKLAALAVPPPHQPGPSGPDQFLACATQDGHVTVMHLGHPDSGTPTTGPDQKAEQTAAQKLHHVQMLLQQAQAARQKKQLAAAQQHIAQAHALCLEIIRDYPKTQAGMQAAQLLPRIQ